MFETCNFYYGKDTPSGLWSNVLDVSHKTCRGPYISKNIALCILKEIAVYLTYLPLDKMDAISQTVCSDSLTWMERFVNWVKIHLRWFRSVQFTITQPWFRKWLGAEYMTSHYLNQFWPDSLTHICGTMGRWVKYISWYRWYPNDKKQDTIPRKR